MYASVGSSGPGSGGLANTTNCGLLLTSYLNPTYESNIILASQLYNTTFVPLAIYEDCYLWIGGGSDATTEELDENDTFWIGNMDLIMAISNSIVNFASDGQNTTMAVCGTLPGCQVLGMYQIA